MFDDDVLCKIVEYTTEQLVMKGYLPTSVLEYKMFLGTRWLCSRVRLSSKLAFRHMNERAKNQGFVLIDIDKYHQILVYTRGYPLIGKLSEEENIDIWMKRGALLQRLNNLEKAIFKRSTVTLLNKKK